MPRLQDGGVKPSPFFQMVGKATSRHGIPHGTDIDQMVQCADTFLVIEEKCIEDVKPRTREYFGIKGRRLATQVKMLHANGDCGRLLACESIGAMENEPSKRGQYYTMRALAEMKGTIPIYVLTTSHEDATVHAMGMYDADGVLQCREVSTRQFQDFVESKLGKAREDLRRSNWLRRKPEIAWE